jgi:hypothetical protein
MHEMDSVEYDANTERLLRALGRVVYEMGQLEVALGSLLARMMNEPYMEALAKVAAEDVKWQINRMSELAQRRPNDLQRERFLQSLAAAKSAYTRRNELLHCTWDSVPTESTEPAERLKWARGSTQLATGERLTPDQIWAFADSVQQVHLDLARQIPFIHGWGSDPTTWPRSAGPSDV